MTRDEILAASSMPLASPSYPKGPYRFLRREYLLIHYETDPDALRAFLPEPLVPDGNLGLPQKIRPARAEGDP
jgi:acetoacetate decarboxylase